MYHDLVRDQYTVNTIRRKGLLGLRDLGGLLSPRITSELHSTNLSLDSDYEPSFDFSDSDEDFDDDAYVERFEHARERNGGRASGGRKRRHRHNEFSYRF
nr:hypothetical protein Iba_chr04aCG24400 [Ipomoea batatas]